MRELDNRLMRHIDLLAERYPSLESTRNDIVAAYLLLETEGYERCVHQGSADRDLYDSGTAFAYLSLPVPDVGR